MATIVLQAVGAAVGGIFGPVGAAIGASLGAMGGYAIDNALINSTRHVEGARLNGGRVATAEEGAALPFVYGTVRVSGTLIWLHASRNTRPQNVRAARAGRKSPATAISATLPMLSRKVRLPASAAYGPMGRNWISPRLKCVSIMARRHRHPIR